MNQQNTKRKISPDNTPPIGDDPEKKKNKFNIYWIYGIIFISIIAYNIFRDVNSAGVEISPVQFVTVPANWHRILKQQKKKPDW